MQTHISLVVYKLILAFSLFPVLNAQRTSMVYSNTTVDDIVCPSLILWVKPRVESEIQCARNCNRDVSCLEIHYGTKDKTCNGYNGTVWDIKDSCEGAPGYKWYMIREPKDPEWLFALPTAALYIDPYTETAVPDIVTPTLPPIMVQPAVMPADWTFRLVNGSSPEYGRVEVMHEGEWGQLCDFYLTSAEASQICDNLGISQHGFPIFGSYFGDHQGPNIMQHYSCEPDHSWCEPSLWMTGSCKSAGIHCTDSPSFRLVDGTNSAEGRVEIELGGEWGTVCAMDLHGSNSQDLLCQQLGFTSSSYSGNPITQFLVGTGPIWLQSVHCDTSESKIMECLIASNPSCDHSYDLSLFCNM